MSYFVFVLFFKLENTGVVTSIVVIDLTKGSVVDINRAFLTALMTKRKEERDYQSRFNIRLCFKWHHNNTNHIIYQQTSLKTTNFNVKEEVGSMTTQIISQTILFLLFLSLDVVTPKLMLRSAIKAKTKE